MSSCPTVVVLYVARGDTGGLDHAQQFVDAYSGNPAGIAHDVVFLAKAWSVSERARLGQLARSIAARVVDLPDDGFDWAAYSRGAQLVVHPWLCLLNSHSQPVSAGWLAILMNAANASGVGIAGASGSWESLIPALPRGNATPMGRLRHSFHLAINCRYYGQFRRFPSEHVRSNAVVLRRSLFNRYFNGRPLPKTKRDAQVIESGNSGLYAFIRSLGLNGVVAGRDGKVYAPSDWPISGTFRQDSQRNLLVTDNRTRGYETTCAESKRSLRQMTWGSRSDEVDVR